MSKKRSGVETEGKVKKVKILDEIEFDDDLQTNIVVEKETTSVPQSKPFSSGEMQELRETESLFKSSLFRLAFGEILKESSVKWEKQGSIDIALHAIKGVLDGIGERKTLPWSTLCKSLPTEFSQLTGLKMADKGFPLKFDGIHVVGSFILRCIAKPMTNVDVTVLMPKEMFSSKDFESTYFAKRAAFVISLATEFKKHKMFENYEFLPFCGDYLKPILQITPQSDGTEKFTQTSFKIRIIPQLQDAHSSKNMAVLEDLHFRDHLVEIHEQMKDFPSFVEASILMRVWLRLRGMDQGHNTVNGFLMTYLMTYLFRIRILNRHMSCYQILKNTFNWIAQYDISKPISLVNEKIPCEDPIIFWDKNNINLFHRMTKNSWTEFKSECAISSRLLDDDKKTSSFESLFLKKNHFYSKYDVHLTIPFPKKLKEVNSQKISRSAFLDKVVSVIETAFADRCNFVGVKFPIVGNQVTVGLILLSNWRNVVIRGPSPQNKELKTIFEEFWGEKSQLRRFKDGTIILSTLWTYENQNPIKIVKEIASFILSKHCGVTEVDIVGQDLHDLIHIPMEAAQEYQTVLMKAYEEVKKALLNVKSNLKVNEVLTISPEFRQCSLHPIKVNSRLGKLPTSMTSLIENDNNVTPLRVVLEFQHDTRWPDSLEAIQKVKQLQMLEYHTKMKIKSTPCKEWLDIFCGGFVFRVVIRLPKENTIFQNSGVMLNRKVIELNRELYKIPVHTRAVAVFASRHESYGEAVRLSKKWISSHLFNSHIREELVELLVAYGYIHGDAPETPLNGFSRFITLIANHDWKTSAIYVNLQETKSDRLSNLPYDSSMFVLESYNDTAVPFWTKKGSPSDMIVHRLVTFAKQTEQALTLYFQGNNIQAKQFFDTTKSDFDVVIKLKKLKFTDLTIGFDPIAQYLQLIMDRFERFGLVFRHTEQNYIAIVWNPLMLQKREFNISSSFSMKLDSESKMSPNIQEIIQDLEDMGIGLISKIEQKK